MNQWRKLLLVAFSTAGLVFGALGVAGCADLVILKDEQSGENEQQEAHEHNWREWEVLKQADCENGGKVIYICDEDGAVKAVDTPALGHDYVNGLCVRCVSTDGVLFSLNEEGTGYFVESYTGSKSEVFIAPTYKGLPVTSIGRSAFSNCGRLESVELSACIESIETYAFSGCNNLRSIKFDDNIRLANIQYNAFWNCISLMNIEIPASVVNIVGGAFNGCSSLAEIIVDEGNKNYCSVDGVLFNKTQTELLFYPQTKAEKSYEISESVTSIGDFAFYGSRLTNIKIPANVTSVGVYAFASSRLISIMFAENSKLTNIEPYIFAYCSDLKSIEIPDSVTSIGEFAFGDCRNLTDIYYTGTEEEWNAISKSYVGIPSTAIVHYNYKGE